MVEIGNDWDELLKEEFEKEYYQELRRFLIQEYGEYPVYPSMYDIFNAFKYTPFENVRVVILGQDPYHGPGQAHGLAFSVNKGIPIPPSLKNIFKELERDLGITAPSHGCLIEWAKRGVLLLNSVLTVRGGHANSHRGKGWEELTDKVMTLLNQRKEPMVFMLWGGQAKTKARLLSGKRHLMLTAAHPSPLSAFNGFFGCGHFSLTNEFLKGYGSEIDWGLSDCR
ncbi:MAG: uracil-DNA glycosylase [Anaerovoracaceae bacterium]|jgi:uracil-DNA glycosylase